MKIFLDFWYYDVVLEFEIFLITCLLNIKWKNKDCLVNHNKKSVNSKNLNLFIFIFYQALILIGFMRTNYYSFKSLLSNSD